MKTFQASAFEVAILGEFHDSKEGESRAQKSCFCPVFLYLLVFVSFVLQFLELSISSSVQKKPS